MALRTKQKLLSDIEEVVKKLEYTFKRKPILIGGGALEYYGLRKTGHDWDFMISMEDYKALKTKEKYMKYFNTFGGKELDADGLSVDVDNTFSAVMKLDLDLAITMFQYRYDFFDSERLETLGDFKVMSLEHLLLLKALAASNSEGWDEGNEDYMIRKQRTDVDLILKGIVERKYKKGAWDNAISFNKPMRSLKL